jgi:CLIP-associating protein 1/2
LNSVLPAAIDRLGDSKETVREKACTVITRLMEDVVEPQIVFEKMAPTAFTHKNGKVREETLYLLQNALNR